MKVMMKTKDNGTSHKNAKTRSHIPMNISDTTDELRMDILLPGYSKDDIKIELEDGQLNLWANVQDGDQKYLRREYRTQTFERKFKIPSHIDTDSLEATMKNGILSLFMKKIKPRKIDIQIQ